jgi:hypothetical protein
MAIASSPWKQRAFLAFLLVNANRTVSIDGIIDNLWDGSAPESAPKMVQIYVSKLRKMLARLETQPGEQPCETITIIGPERPKPKARPVCQDQHIGQRCEGGSRDHPGLRRDDVLGWPFGRDAHGVSSVGRDWSAGSAIRPLFDPGLATSLSKPSRTRWWIGGMPFLEWIAVAADSARATPRTSERSF